MERGRGGRGGGGTGVGVKLYKCLVGAVYEEEERPLLCRKQ
jgi:hypothetical protein